MSQFTPKDRSYWSQAKFSGFEKARAYRINQWQESGLCRPQDLADLDELRRAGRI